METVITGAVGAVVAAAIISPVLCFICLMNKRLMEMDKEPKLPHKLKWGDRTAARVDEVEYLIGIRVVGYTSLKDVILAEVHESVADEVGAWHTPEDLMSVGGYVFMKKPEHITSI